MAQSFWVGIALVLVAALMAGECIFPLNFNRKWRWDNTWLIFSFVSLIVLPWMAALSLVEHLFQADTELTTSQFALPILLGAGWWKDAPRFARALRSESMICLRGNDPFGKRN
jgi:L-rhamnose-proton symport protein (RhaT)